MIKSERHATLDGGEMWLVPGTATPHRQDGPARTTASGRKSWYRNGDLHREDGPALIDPQRKLTEYHVNGLLHRLDGPAIIDVNGSKYWFIDGIRYRTEEEFEHAAKPLRIKQRFAKTNPDIHDIVI
jgi:hypothetical protein